MKSMGCHHRSTLLACCAVLIFACDRSSDTNSETETVPETSPVPNRLGQPETLEESKPAPNCARQREICNELDDDCDGQVDELADVRLLVYDDLENCGQCGARCEAPRSVSVCIAAQCVITQCDNGYTNPNGQYEDGCEARCVPSPDAEEVCDGSDNDCDGMVDEGYDLRTNGEHCGGCNQRCIAAPNARVACQDGRCQTDGCLTDWYDLNGVRADGCEYGCTTRSTDAVIEFCNGLDDDCDGYADEMADLEEPNVACASEGICAAQCLVQADCSEGELCDAGGACIPIVGSPQETQCETDRECMSLHPNFICLQHNYLVQGRWVREGWCQAKVFHAYCAGDRGFQCPEDAGSGNTDERGQCDGLDNDCDGRVDEDFAADLYVEGSTQVPRSCFEGLGVCRRAGSVRCDDEGIGTVCDAVPGLAIDTVDDECDGIDQDCDGSVDEDFEDVWVSLGDYAIYAYEGSRPTNPDDFESNHGLRACSRPGVVPWNNLSWGEARAACEAANARLCSPMEWTLACGGPDPSDEYTYGGEFMSGRCNHGVNQGLPALQSTGADAMCQRDGVFDLTGNVKEWIDIQEGNSRGLRGGAFSTPVQSGLTCTQDGDWKDRNFRNPAIGFRCCRDITP